MWLGANAVGDFNSDEDDPLCTTPLCVAYGVAGFTPDLILSSPVLDRLKKATPQPSAAKSA